MTRAILGKSATLPPSACTRLATITASTGVRFTRRAVAVKLIRAASVLNCCTMARSTSAAVILGWACEHPPVVLRRDAGLCAERAYDLVDSQPFGDRDSQLDPRARAEQQVEGERRLHMPVQPVRAWLKRSLLRALLRSLDKGPRACDNAELEQRLRHVGRGFILFDRNDHSPVAGSGVVGWHHVRAEEVVSDNRAAGEKDRDNQQRDQRRTAPPDAAPEPAIPAWLGGALLQREERAVITFGPAR